MIVPSIHQITKAPSVERTEFYRMPANKQDQSRKVTPSSIQAEMRTLLEANSQCGELIRVVLSKPAGDVPPDTPQKLTIRPVEIKGEYRYQVTSRHKTQESHENLGAAEMIDGVMHNFPGVFMHCHVFSVAEDVSFKSKKNGKLQILRSKASLKPEATTHNRAKSYLIPEGQPCRFLAAIGVMTEDGTVRKAKYPKFRQINRFLELVNDVVDQLPEVDVLRVVDFGCGKSYLTFALHHLLTTILNRKVQIIGLDRRADVIETCHAVSRQLRLKDLEFKVGDIASHTAESEVHLAVSLHACDTATDDALIKAMGWNANVVLAVPCCQHELAGKIQCDELSSMLSHGLVMERMAALATDSLRAKALQARGYKTQLVEFIDMEHTPKNVLIRAVRGTSSSNQAAADEYASLKKTLGLDKIHTDQILEPAT